MTALVQAFDIRTAVLSATQSDAGVTALIPAAQQYPAVVASGVVWPFIRHGTVQELPQRHDGLAGPVYGSIALSAVHVFAKAGNGMPDAERFCGLVCREVARVLEAMDAVVLNGEPSLSVQVTQSEVIQDGAESGAFHGIVQYEASAF